MVQNVEQYKREDMHEVGKKMLNNCQLEENNYGDLQIVMNNDNESFSAYKRGDSENEDGDENDIESEKGSLWSGADVETGPKIFENLKLAFSKRIYHVRHSH